MSKKLIYLVCFALVLSVAGNASADMVAHWAFDEGSGTTAFDSSGNGNDGTLQGDPKWVTGKIGGALEFNGTDSIIDIPYSPNMTPSEGTTMSAWVFPTDTTRSCIVGQFQGYGMALLGGLQLKSVIWGADWVLSDVTIPVQEWSHIAMTWDVTNAERMVFLNGELVGQRGDAAVPDVQNNMGIGLWVGWTGGDDAFMGIIDDVRIYDHILSEVELLGAMTGEVFPYAFCPTPEDDAMLESTWANISWKPGGFAVSHDVYFGDNFGDVNAGAEGTFQGNQASTNLIVGFPGFACPDGLVPGTTYYWRIDEVNDTDPNSPWRGDVWSFTVPPRTAYNPDPADGVKFVYTDVELSWIGGFGAKLHTVYFGDNFDDVNNAVVGLPQADTIYTPSPLELEKTYYWRVDEFDGVATYKGDVWSFTTLPVIPITDPNLVVWWTLDEGSGSNALDWSGHGNHGTLNGDPQWVDGYFDGALEFDGTGDYVEVPRVVQDDFTLMAWIKTDTPGLSLGSHAYQGSGLIWSDVSGVANDFLLGVLGTKLSFFCGNPDVSVNSNRDVVTGQWVNVAAVRSAQQSKISIYIDGEHEKTVAHENKDPLDAQQIIAIGGNTLDSRYFTGFIDDVRMYDVALIAEEVTLAMRGNLLLAWNPNPANGSTVYIRDATPLSWSPGDIAAQHDVYFGTDKGAVADANASDTTGIYRGRQGVTIYTPPEVEWGGGPYYWRVDEYNTDATISKGNVWSFTVADFIGIDDIEDYNDYPPDEIFSTWIDGWEVPENGSMAGHADPPFAETGNVHGGGQSMPLYYENNFKYSEITMTLVSVRDWTEEGVGVLSLWFYGDAANAAERMYVALNGSATVYHDNPNAALIDTWMEWTIDLQAFAAQGVNLANVNTITIGFGDKNNLQAGGSGMVLFDDIRLYRPAPPEPEPAPEP